jgi:RNA polymerase sigma factor (sigma-70 family)
MNENKWLNEISKGNQLAQKALYDGYATQVYNTILSYVKNREDAEELLQDVFISVFNKAHLFRAEASVSTWIYQITVNKSLDFLRKKSSKKRQGFFILTPPEKAETSQEPIEFMHPGVKMENAEDAKLLFQVIDELSENQKTAFILTQAEGLPQKEVAAIMMLSPKSVESLLQRAKANLRSALEKHHPHRGKSLKNTSK